MACEEWFTISVVNLVLQVYSDERFGWAEVCVCKYIPVSLFMKGQVQIQVYILLLIMTENS